MPPELSCPDVFCAKHIVSGMFSSAALNSVKLKIPNKLVITFLFAVFYKATNNQKQNYEDDSNSWLHGHSTFMQS